jgi:hypothetical protein
MLAAVGCAHPSANAQKGVLEKYYDANIGIVNHTDHLVYSTTVNGNEGGHAYAWSAGVGSMCCVPFPMKWYPGLQIEVVWDMPEGTKDIYKKKIVDVEKYDEPGTIYLHFFPNDEVRVVVTDWIGSSPNHPIPPPPRRKKDQS